MSHDPALCLVPCLVSHSPVLCPIFRSVSWAARQQIASLGIPAHWGGKTPDQPPSVELLLLTPKPWQWRGSIWYYGVPQRSRSRRRRHRSHLYFRADTTESRRGAKARLGWTMIRVPENGPDERLER